MSVDHLKNLLKDNQSYVNNLILLSNNVNGLSNDDKRKLLSKYIKTVNAEIILLQEIHNNKYLNKGEFLNFKKYYSIEKEKKWGVAILVKSNSQLEINEIIKDEIGCLIAIKGKINNEKFLFCSIYIPHRLPEAFQTIDKLKKTINDNTNYKVIVGGDFNFEVKQNSSGYKNNVRNYYNTKIDHLLEDTKTKNNSLSTVTFTHTQFNTHTNIDRILTNKNLTDQITFHFTSSTSISDHNPIFIGIKIHQIDIGKPKWILKITTLENENVKKVVTRLLTEIKPNNILWATHFDNLIDKLSTELKLLQKELNTNRNNVLTKLNNKLIALEVMGNINDIKYKQIKDKINEIEIEKLNNKCYEEARFWYANGEKPTKSFFNRNKEKTSNVISSMRYNNKQAKSTSDMLKFTHDYFKSLYASKQINIKSLDETMRKVKAQYSFESHPEKLNLEFNEKEIENAIDNLAPEKAPGPDGLVMALFKNFKTLWTPILENLFNEITKRKKTPKNFENSRISLVPKPTTPTNDSEPKDWRPITLTNSAYKIFTKCLANRLTDIVEKRIGPHQTGFVQGRDIRENILTAQSLIEHYKTNNQKIALLLLDWEKAFDRVDHRSLIKILKHLDFPPTILNAIKAIYRNSWAAIKINNKVSQQFKINSGVKQGCPLSPILFIIIIEVLHTQFKLNENIKQNPLIKQKSQGYADDTLLLVNNNDELNEFLNEIKTYCNITGAKVNDNKSKMLIIGKWVNIPNNVIITNAENGLKYLGAKISFPIDKNCWEKIKNNIVITLRRWKYCPLSLFGKKIIVETLALSKLWYLASIFFIPHEILKIIESLVSKFYKGTRKKNPIQIKRLTVPKDKGGLDFLDIRAKSTALTAKWIVKYLTTKQNKLPLTPWMRILENHINNKDIKPIHPLARNFNRNATQYIFDNLTDAWRRIHIRQFDIKINDWVAVIKNNRTNLYGKVIEKLENGNIKIISYDSDFLNEKNVSNHVISNSDIIQIKPIIATNKIIKKQIISREHQLNSIKFIKMKGKPFNIVKFISDCSTETKDLINSVTNTLLIRSAKDALKIPKLPKTLTVRFSEKQMEKLIENAYQLNLNNRVKEFLIYIIYDCLPTCAYLHKTKQIPSSVCTNCYEADETIDHALFECVDWIDNSLIAHTKNYFIKYDTKWDLIKDVYILEQEKLISIIITLITLHSKWNMRARSKTGDFSFGKYYVIINEQIKYFEKNPERTLKSNLSKIITNQTLQS